MIPMKKPVAVLKAYAKTFSTTDELITYKTYHSIRVSKMAKRIAKCVFPDAKNRALATAIGLLHDWGRFSQWTRFRTTRDRASFNHGDEGVRLLFEQGDIQAFDYPKNWYPIMAYAIANHNKLEIDVSGAAKLARPECALVHAKLVRDADKLDIYFAVIHHLNPQNYYPIGDPNPTLLKHIANKEHGSYQEVHTKLDEALFFIAMAFELHFSISKKIVTKRHYIKRLSKSYKNLLPLNQYQMLLKIAKHFSF